ncbi:hypothetical protein VB776_16210 [Arcicella sp. DC2W]|uniref:Uncharacterized protein n=1 Tax=Arcicella gelida TaxID=2984195 RepID=A0ABU5S7P4_9BACT|nr:hypothetical protein [Arcicella sp. DC2W]MEA5404477.1 hypothetical protein [Arcicella sp. DC2W]
MQPQINTPILLASFKHQFEVLETNRIIAQNAENEEIYFNSVQSEPYNSALHSELSQLLGFLEFIQGKTLLYNLEIEAGHKKEYLLLS